MRKMTGVYISLMFASLVGCAQLPARHAVVRPETDAVTAHVVPVQTIDNRIGILKEILENGDLSEGDRETARRLLDIYRSLEALSSSTTTRQEYRQVIQGLYQCLSRLDKQYFSEKRGLDYTEFMSLFSKRRRAILKAYLAYDYKEVIDLCVQLRSDFGPLALFPDLGLLFSLSLAREGKPEEAVKVGEGLLAELEAVPSAESFRAKIAELQLQQGQPGKALIIYQKLADSLDSQEALLRSLNRKIAAAIKNSSGQGSGSQGSPVMERPEGPLLEEAERLASEHRFGEARDVLLDKRTGVSPGPETESIDKALRALDLSEEKYLEQRISMLSKKKSALESAKNLIEEERFEDALSDLRSIAPEGREDPNINALEEKAINGIVNRERNRAARLYLHARRTEDREKKEKLLLSSYEILNNLLNKYPASSLNKKIKNHIKVVSEALENIGRQLPGDPKSGTK